MSQLERLAEAIVQVGKQSGPAQQSIARTQQAASRLAPMVPNDQAGYSRTIRTHLYAAAEALRDVERLLTDFDKQADAFAKRLVGGSEVGMVASSGAADSGQAELNATDRAALADYTGDGFSEINEGLRAGKMSKDVQERAARLSDALGKLPDHSGEVFRGTTLTSDQIASYVPGQFRVEKAFTSTSSDRSQAFDGNMFFIMYSRSGKDVQKFSQMPGESEVLFDRGSTFYVHQNSDAPGTGKRVIVLVEVPHA